MHLKVELDKNKFWLQCLIAEFFFMRGTVLFLIELFYCLDTTAALLILLLLVKITFYKYFVKAERIHYVFKLIF